MHWWWSLSFFFSLTAAAAAASAMRDLARCGLPGGHRRRRRALSRPLVAGGTSASTAGTMVSSAEAQQW